VRRAILDKWTVVPPGMTIGYDKAEDERRFTMTPSGIAVVPARYAFNGAQSVPLEFSAHFPRPGE
jgi:glucose-1-phosphate adenylyltransferase